MTTTSRPRRNEEMKFAYAGPFVTLLDPIRTLGPKDDLEITRSPRGEILSVKPGPRYAATSAERYDIGAAIGPELERELGVRFGSNAVVTNRPNRRRGSRGGRKPVAS